MLWSCKSDNAGGTTFFRAMFSFRVSEKNASPFKLKLHLLIAFFDIGIGL